MIDLDRPYAERCGALADAGRLRVLPSPTAPPTLDFSHNDYLGLARHPALVEAACEAARRWGVGATGARLLSGSFAVHEQLEARIAADKGTEAALLFATGYQANASVIAALLDPVTLGAVPLVFADRLVHASIHEGVRLAGATQHRFRHNDLAHLEELLARHRASGRHAFILAESVYGMDGDRADVDALARVARAYDAMLYVDEAHATGVFGARGYGLACGLPRDLGAVVMGTFSKALGGAGAYVACSAALRAYLVNRCAGFVFSTAPAPPLVAAAFAAWRLVPSLHAERARIASAADRLRTQLRARGFDTGASQTQIVPVAVGDDRAVVRLRDRLREHGIAAAAIRPPTVPPNGARLRLSVAATHRDEDVDRLVAALAELA